MLDSFLEVAYEVQTRKQATFELVGLLKDLPDMELRKLAAGTPVAELYGHLDKTASMCGPDGEPMSFLDRFKGTPLLEQAIALEQQELQAEMTDMQKRQEQRAQRQGEDSLYDAKDRIRVQKRLLELELAKQEGGGEDPNAAMAAGGAPPPMAPPGAGPPAPAALPGAPGEALKQAFVVPYGEHKAPKEHKKKKEAQEKLAFADGLGRALARNDAERAGRAGELHKVGAAAGAMMAKTALNLSSIGTAAKGLMSSGGAQKALQFATKNPALVGAGVGAAGGAVAGGPEHRLSGALGGAALGAGAGHMGGKLLSSSGGPVSGVAAKAREALLPAPHGALSVAPAGLKASTYADPSVFSVGPRAPGSMNLGAPNIMTPPPPRTLKERMMGLVS